MLHLSFWSISVSFAKSWFGFAVSVFEPDQVLGKNVNRRWRECGAEERLLGPEKNYKDGSGICDAEPGQGF